MEAEIVAVCEEKAALVHDRQVVQNVKLSPVLAAYVDNVAVIDENRPRVMGTIPTIKSSFESDGPRSKGTEEPSDC